LRRGNQLSNNLYGVPIQIIWAAISLSPTEELATKEASYARPTVTEIFFHEKPYQISHLPRNPFLNLPHDK